MPATEADRPKLARLRASLARAKADVPVEDRSLCHLGPILANYIRSIDERIGPDTPAGLTGPCLGLHGEDCRCEPAPEAYPGREEFLTAIRRANTVPAVDDDSEMPFGLPALAEAASHPKAGDVDERSTAHDPREC